MGDEGKKNVDLIKKDALCKKELQDVYEAYKKLFIRAEEKLEEMGFFVAPMLEHRDALDHLMRYFSLVSEGEITEETLKQLEKAVGHEYRAYFDVADYICITVREKIAESLKGISKRKMQSVWKEYSDVKRKVVKISDEISEIRYNRRGNMDSVKKYDEMLKEIFEIYDDFICDIEPRLQT